MTFTLAVVHGNIGVGLGQFRHLKRQKRTLEMSKSLVTSAAFRKFCTNTNTLFKTVDVRGHTFERWPCLLYCRDVREMHYGTFIIFIVAKMVSVPYIIYSLYYFTVIKQM